MLTEPTPMTEVELLVAPSYVLSGERPRQNQTLSIELLDELIDANVSARTLERLLWMRRVTRGKKARLLTMAEMAGMNLRGKAAYAYFSNWEDSEWVYSDEAHTVVQDDHGNYSFAYDGQIHECWNCQCGHDDQDDCVDLPLEIGYSFPGYTEAIVIWT